MRAPGGQLSWQKDQLWGRTRGDMKAQWYVGQKVSKGRNQRRAAAEEVGQPGWGLDFIPGLRQGMESVAWAPQAAWETGLAAGVRTTESLGCYQGVRAGEAQVGPGPGWTVRGGDQRVLSPFGCLQQVQAGSLLGLHRTSWIPPWSRPLTASRLQPTALAGRLNLQRTLTHLNPFIAKLLFNNYITVPTVLHNEISMRDIRENIKL